MEPSPRAKVSVRALIVLAIVALCVYVIDQVSKFLVVQNLTPDQEIPVLGQLLQFRFVENPGAAFSIGSGSTWIFSIIGTAVLIFVIWYAPRIRSLAWAVLFGLLLGGLLGNLTDRLVRAPGFGLGHVVDFLQIPLLPAIFNVADVGIVSSMGLFLILTIRGVALDGTRHGHTVAEPETELDQAEISDGHLPDAGTPDGDSAPGGPESRSDAA
ncbi:MAG: signal peptidase [Leifsonia sp.]|nr:signal peptidase [Leifsonia sp.]MDQ1588844.1 signal peptidase [Microbacteriaceae bacterium]